MKHKLPQEPAAELDATLRRVRREHRRGHHRQALLLLRKAAFEQGQTPGVWTRYALYCARQGKSEDAQRAFAQAVFLCRKEGSEKRAELTSRVAEEAQRGCLPRTYSKK